LQPCYTPGDLTRDVMGVVNLGCRPSINLRFDRVFRSALD
jgi:hypothetical protein